MKAQDILEAAAGHMKDRAATYDKPEGERSMGATVEAFKAVTGHQMTEEQGWLFMALLKAVRSQQGAYRQDSYEDGAAYFSLAGESASRDRKKPAAAMAAAWEEGEKRMEQIGPNGSDGLAYEKEWIPTNGNKPDLPDGTLVDIKFADGTARVGAFYDTTHYRIHQPECNGTPSAPEHGERVADDGWIEWEGGECPVDHETVVEIEMRGGHTGTSMACEYYWGHYNAAGDIIRYRVV